MKTAVMLTVVMLFIVGHSSPLTPEKLGPGAFFRVLRVAPAVRVRNFAGATFVSKRSIGSI